VKRPLECVAPQEKANGPRKKMKKLRISKKNLDSNLTFFVFFCVARTKTAAFNYCASGCSCTTGTGTTTTTTITTRGTTDGIHHVAFVASIRQWRR